MKHPISITRFNVHVHRQWGLGFTVDWWLSRTVESQSRYAPWPTPHSEVVQVEHQQWVGQLRLTLIAWTIRVTVPLWEVSP